MPDKFRQLDGANIAVVGGGILGMYLALRLRQRGAEAHLYESAPATGGLASSADVGGYEWDRFYHVMLLSDLHLMALVEELGLDSELVWGVTKTGFYTDGQLTSMSNALEFLQFPPLGLIDKFRLGATIFYASRIKRWHRLESILAVDWLRKLSGRHVVEKIWLPLLKSKLGENYNRASAAFIWAIIARMYAARRAGLKREMFGYINGGYKVILDQLQARLDQAGVVTHFSTRVNSVTTSGGRVQITTNQDVQTHDHAVMTIPTDAIADVCENLTTEEKQRLDGVTYQGIVCPSFVLKKSLSPYYVTNITDRDIPFTGVIEMTTLVDRSQFDGNALVYLPFYLTQDSAFWERSDADIAEECVAVLQRMYPHFEPSDVIDWKIARARKVLAVTTLEYSTKWAPAISTSLGNVHVLNSAQIANGTLNVNETLGIVNDNLESLCASIQAKTVTREAS